MDAARLVQLRQRLEAERDALLEDGNLRIDPNRDDTAEGRPDEDAQPLNEMNQVIASKRNAERAARLAQVRQALVRLESSPEDFGYCGECEEEIGERRMEVMPWSKRCVRCQSRRDPERKGRRRSLTDYD